MLPGLFRKDGSMLQNKKVSFLSPWKVALETAPLDAAQIPAGHVLLQKKYSLISAGTELACLAGTEGWFPLPGQPGYVCVGEVLQVADDVKDVQAGMQAYCYGAHCLYEMVPASGIFMPVPEDLPLRWACFARMGTIAATSIRASSIEWGDLVAVTGQGQVGLMAIQLAKLQGAETIAIDRMAHRLEVAQQCGADHVIHTESQDVAAEIRRISGGRMLSTLIEATGNSAVFAQALPWVRRNGEAILLGSPRGAFVTDLTPLLNKTHLSDSNITVKGAQEWQYPTTPDPFVKHSIWRNTELIFSLMARNKLAVEPLLTQEVKPEECAQVYDNLRRNQDEYLGVLFNWQ